MLAREGHVGQHVVLALIHQCGELGPAATQLVGDVPPGLMRRLGIGLQEGLSDRGGDHRVLALWHMRQGVPNPMNPALCQVAPSTRVIASRKPSWPSEITSFTPLSPRLTRLFRKADQNGSASEGPMPSPTISRRPSLFTATAIIAATDTMRPPSRTFR